MSIINKLGLGALGVVVITNPASGQFILWALDKAFQMVFQYGSWVNFGASGVLFVVLLVKMYQGRERVNIPAKSKKVPVVMG